MGRKTCSEENLPLGILPFYFWDSHVSVRPSRAVAAPCTFSSTMRSAMFFEITSILFCFRYAAARVSNATCGSSYNWMLNVYQQDPCTVAAYLVRVCDAGPEFVVPALGPGEYYPGPSLQKSNPCRCSSVLYSLLSACAVCQSRQYLSWSTYHRNCSSVYSNFTGDIPAVTSVAAWAYQNVTKFNGFNVSVAEIDASVPASASSFESSGQISTTPVSTANLPSNTRLVQGVENSGELYNRKIAWAVIGVVCFLSISIALAITFKLWRHQHRRPKSIAPSAAYHHRYRYAPVTLTTLTRYSRKYRQQSNSSWHNRY
ncbi:hypothetical protein B0H14DRAFT_22212 [Mycena olivaceomarginata]|nr:hypothetical protein B0H14DRAFT_22212 [Mycena olivaceomarginata]